MSGAMSIKGQEMSTIFATLFGLAPEKSIMIRSPIANITR
jgi:hypothetical protein